MLYLSLLTSCRFFFSSTFLTISFVKHTQYIQVQPAGYLGYLVTLIIKLFCNGSLVSGSDWNILKPLLDVFLYRQIINPTDFVDPLTLHLVLPWGRFFMYFNFIISYIFGLLDGLQFGTDIHAAQRMNPNDFGGLYFSSSTTSRSMFFPVKYLNIYFLGWHKTSY